MNGIPFDRRARHAGEAPHVRRRRERPPARRRARQDRKSRAGRPTEKPPPPRTLRRRMHQRLRRPAERKLYGQRWQIETVNSMIKRNLGSALRARTTVHRRPELLLRVL